LVGGGEWGCMVVVFGYKGLSFGNFGFFLVELFSVCDGWPFQK